MNLISITCSASPSRGYTYEDAEAMLDLFDTVLDGRATEKTLDSMLAITSAAVPVTASARKGMKAVRLPGDRSRPDLAEVTNRFWKAYAAKHPQPVEPNRQPLKATMRQRRAR